MIGQKANINGTVTEARRSLISVWTIKEMRPTVKLVQIALNKLVAKKGFEVKVLTKNPKIECRGKPGS
jgi:hypothetical protein